MSSVDPEATAVDAGVPVAAGGGLDWEAQNPLTGRAGLETVATVAAGKTLAFPPLSIPSVADEVSRRGAELGRRTRGRAGRARPPRRAGDRRAGPGAARAPGRAADRACR